VAVQVDPSYRWLARLSPARGITPQSLPWLRRVGDLTGRVSRPVWGVRSWDVEQDGARVRVYQPGWGSQPAALLWVHGGGLVMGAAEQDEARASGLAAALGITVVSARYRLAPEHPFPAGLDDCRAAWYWLQRNAARLGVDPDRVAIGGASAGAGLAAALAQRLHDESGPRPVAQLLVYPMLDDRTALHSDRDPVEHPVWNNASNAFGWASYLGSSAGMVEPPEYAVPARRTNLAGLPPAWVGIGTADLFLDEARTYASRLSTAGVPVELVEVPRAPHGFDTVTAPPESQRFLASQLGFLTEALGLPPNIPQVATSALPPPDWIPSAPITVRESVEIAADPAAVWAHVTDHAGWPEWFAGVRRVQVTGRASGVGGRRRVLAGPLRLDEVFTAWEPERHFAFAVVSSSVPLVDRLAESVLLEPVRGGTRVTYRQGLAARPGRERMLAATWGRVAAQLPDSLLRLKARAEAAPAG
jgi:acetyl esterase/lipase/uncharacterized protein YndB with AHSA1/START domain